MSPDNLSALRLSLQVAVAATALNALVGIPVAYVLARRRFWGRSLVDLLVTLPLVLPPTVVGYYLIVLLGPARRPRRAALRADRLEVAFTWYAAVIAATVMALPLLVRTVRAAIESVDRDLERAAYTLGRSELRTALEVTLPLARNGILAGLVLAFARALGEFGATLMLAGNIPGRTATVPLSIYTAVQTGESGEALGAGRGAHRALLSRAGCRPIAWGPARHDRAGSRSASARRCPASRWTSSGARATASPSSSGRPAPARPSRCSAWPGSSARTRGRIVVDDQVLFDSATGIEPAAPAAPRRLRVPGLRAVPAPHACAGNVGFGLRDRSRGPSGGAGRTR